MAALGFNAGAIGEMEAGRATGLRALEGVDHIADFPAHITVVVFPDLPAGHDEEDFLKEN